MMRPIMLQGSKGRLGDLMQLLLLAAAILLPVAMSRLLYAVLE